MITPLDPDAAIVRTPWKNGGGVTVDIACATATSGASAARPSPRPGRSPTTPASIACRCWSPGRGLVLQTPDGEIDVRRPFQPVRFAGETPIVSRLEAGPVEVINLMGERSRVRIDLVVLDAGLSQPLGPGMHIAYCPAGRAILRLAARTTSLQADQRPQDRGRGRRRWPAMAGLIVLGSVICVSR